MLTKTTTVDRVEVLSASGHIQVRERISVLEDGSEISATFHRYVLEKNADLTGQPDEVRSIAEAAWADAT